MKQFSEDVRAGLSKSPKTLPSKYFYNKKGDELFIKIMGMPEYYLTRSEMEIVQRKGSELVNALGFEQGQYFELIELGAGDGYKTKELLKVLLKEDYNFEYIPIDISPNVLNQLKANFNGGLPGLRMNAQAGDYFNILNDFKASEHPKVVLFLGSNIGNLTDEEAQEFIYKLGANLRARDKLILGVDLIKAQDIVLPAYNDAAGITRDFNLNLLDRINTELGADFDVAEFKHAPEYTEEEGIAKSYLESGRDQTVTIEGEQFSFAKGERIHTEISRKYNDEVMTRILSNTDFIIADKFTDSKGYFADYVLERQ